MYTFNADTGQGRGAAPGCCRVALPFGSERGDQQMMVWYPVAKSL